MHDEWCGQSSFRDLYPSLYVLDRHYYAFITDNFQLLGGSVVWVLHFRLNLQDNEAAELGNMLTLLEMNSLSLERMDNRVWKLDSTGNFQLNLSLMC